VHVSVVLAVFNDQDRVAMAVDTIRHQSFTDWDLIIVDDASTDGTSRIVQQLAKEDPRISVITNSKNRGLAGSLNMGWRAAKGELIALLNANDECHCDRLRLQEQYMAEHPEVDVLGTGAALLTSEGVSLGISPRPTEHAELVKAMYKESPFFHSSVMARRRYYERFGGYNERIRYSHDSDLWLRSYQTSRFANLPCAMVRYRTKPRQGVDRSVWALRVFLVHAWQEGKLLQKSWYILRYAFAAVLSWFHLYEHRARPR
jgi:glycosyltransferase involved in cell wall biosynthesis